MRVPARVMALAAAAMMAAAPADRAIAAAQASGDGVGVEAWTLTDSTRPYGTQGRPRPVRAVVWYPARVAPERPPATIETLARRGWISPDNAVTGAERPRIQRAFARDATGMAPAPPAASAIRAAFRAPAVARWAAPALDGRHPAVLVVSGAGSRPYFHLTLAERLAGAGFVVAHVQPLGTEPGRAPGFDIPGIEGAARDAAIVLDRLRSDPRVDGQRVGTLSWSVGGVVALRLQRLRPGVITAGVSLDSGAGYDYGPPLIAAADVAALAAERTPLLHLSAGVANSVRRDPSLLSALGAEFRTIDGLRHADFASIAWVGRGRDVAVEAMEAAVTAYFAARLRQPTAR
ncbi:MAG: hypothetical protein R2708_22350 [Vicinamibacterales bacterium]